MIFCNGIIDEPRELVSVFFDTESLVRVGIQEAISYMLLLVAFELNHKRFLLEIPSCTSKLSYRRYMKRVVAILNALSQIRKGNSPRDKLLCVFLVFYARSWHRRFLGKLLTSFISLFAKDGQVTVGLNLEGKPVSISMRQNNGPDYRMAITVLLLHEYHFPKSGLPETIVDGGANIGAFTILVHARFPHARLICYEPDYANLQQLKLNLEMNNIDAVLHDEALWFEDTQIWFHRDESHKGFASTQPSELKIQASRPDLDQLTWLKMDIEGGEFKVLPRLLKHPDKRPCYIFLEAHWGKLSHQGEALEFIDSLQDQSYEFEQPINLQIFSQSLLLASKIPRN